MTTTREDLRTWLAQGKEQGATHTIIVCDTFDYEDYPVHVMPGEDARAVAAKYNNPDEMSRVMEVYSHALDPELQLSQHRSFNY